MFNRRLLSSETTFLLVLSDGRGCTYTTSDAFSFLTLSHYCILYLLKFALQYALCINVPTLYARVCVCMSARACMCVLQQLASFSDEMPTLGPAELSDLDLLMGRVDFWFVGSAVSLCFRARACMLSLVPRLLGILTSRALCRHVRNDMTAVLSQFLDFHAHC